VVEDKSGHRFLCLLWVSIDEDQDERNVLRETNREFLRIAHKTARE
jgi:hypothetical protein